MILTWVVNSARGSIAAAALVHGWFGLTLSAIPFLPSESIMPLNTDLLTTTGDLSLMSAYILMAVMFWVVALFLVLVTRGQLAWDESIYKLVPEA